jgi:hypothetical protein
MGSMGRRTEDALSSRFSRRSMAAAIFEMRRMPRASPRDAWREMLLSAFDTVREANQSKPV